MKWWTIGGVALAIAASSVPAGADLPCPCKYTVPGAPYVTSAQPFSDALKACVVPVGSFLKWLKDSSERRKDAAFSGTIFESTFGIFSKFDWGAPKAEVARDMMDRSLKTLADNIADMKRRMAERDDSRKSSGDTDNSIAQLEKAISDMETSSFDINAMELQRDTAMATYMQCVIANKIPETGKW